MKKIMPIEKAEALAGDLIARLNPYCERLQVAGSVRRQVPLVGDIELLAVPKAQLDMFGGTLVDHTLDLVNWSDIGRCIKSGHKYKQVELPGGINLDLWIVTPPAQWGVQFLLRTGPEDFSRRLVTIKHKGGLLPSYFRVKDGAIWKGKTMIETPEEADVFKLVGLPYMHPRER